MVALLNLLNRLSGAVFSKSFAFLFGIVSFAAAIWLINIINTNEKKYSFATSFGSTPEGTTISWQKPLFLNKQADDVFLSTKAGPRASKGQISARFRLAGTFFVLSDSDKGIEIRKVVLDDLKEKTQLILAEGDTVEDISVLKIFQDHVLLSKSGLEEELWMNFSKTDQDNLGPLSSKQQNSASNLNQNKFGGRLVSENRWIFERQPLLDYYKSLTDNPERMVLLFDSLKPVYNENNQISGYRVDIEGEKEFFESVGLLEGDIVKRANSLDMTSRRRADFLIRQFIENKANAYVLDVNRDGKDIKLVYEIR